MYLFSKNENNRIMRYILVSLIAAFFILNSADAVQDDKKQEQKVFFPDEYSVLDDPTRQQAMTDELVLSSMEKSRQYYLQALVFIESGDTLNGAKFFERSLKVLNRLVSYPGIENNEEFTDLAQSIIEDYESFVSDINMIDENTSLFIIRERLDKEIEKIAVNPSEIKTIALPDKTAVSGIEDLTFTIPMPDNEYVQKNYSFFTENPWGIKFVNKVLARQSKWMPMITKIAREEEMPWELVYLAMIESGLNPNAVSRAKAVGLWQFMRATGKMYGLNENSSIWIDERRDPEKATIAAMRHLRDLYNEFGDWHLAMAAYNCGAGGVKRAIRKSKLENPDYWSIRKYLPKETRHYVPRFIAMTMFAMDPEKYGFNSEAIEPESEYEYEIFTVNEPVSLSAIAKCAGISEDVIADLNPELVRSCTPPDMEYYNIKIPTGMKTFVEAKFDSLTPEEKLPWIFHEVKRGESIYSLASKYKVTKKEIVSMNDLKSTRSKLSTGQIVKIPVNREEFSTQSTDVAESKRSGEDIVHVVQPGDNLNKIASNFGVRVTDIRNLNNIPYNRDNINVGDELIISKAASDTKKVSTEPKGVQPVISKIETPKVVKHKVKKGETLAQIADEYGVTIQGIRDLNRVKRNKIYVNQILRIETSGNKVASKSSKPNNEQKITHKVRRGETLSTIAGKYGVTENEIKKWNPGKISGETIYRNSYLAIYSDKTAKGSSKATSSKVNKAPKYYKIRRGDTLGEIAEKFGISVSSLKRKNPKVNENRLQIGQRIRIQ